jgi:hypothetical protein
MDFEMCWYGVAVSRAKDERRSGRGAGVFCWARQKEAFQDEAVLGPTEIDRRAMTS